MSIIAIFFWRSWWRRPLQASLLLFSIAIAVAMVFAIDIANRSALSALAWSQTLLYGKATHLVRARYGLLPEALYPWLIKELNVEAAPVLRIPIQDQQGKNWQVLALDFLPSNNQRPALQDIVDTNVLQKLWQTPFYALISQKQAERLQLAQDADLPFVDLPKPLRLAATFSDTYQEFDQTVFMDIAAAQVLFNKIGQLSWLEFTLTSESSLLLAEKLADFPTEIALELVDLAKERQAQQGLSQSFRTSLLAMSFLALVVAVFLIYNILSFHNFNRSKQLVLLQSLGTTPQQLNRWLWLEAVFIAVLSSIVGLFIGLWLAQVLHLLVMRSFADLYFSQAVTPLWWSAWSVIKSLFLGLLATLLATFFSRWVLHNASSSSLKQDGLRRTWLWWLALSGLLLLILIFLLLNFAPPTLASGFIALFLMLLVAAFWLPLLWHSLLIFSRWLFKPFGLVYRLLFQGIIRNFSHTFIAVLALSLALATALSITWLVDSFRQSVATWLVVILPADGYLVFVGENGDFQTFDPSVVIPALQQVPGLAMIRPARTFSPTSASEFAIFANSLPSEKYLENLLLKQVLPTAEIVKMYQTGQGVIISEPLAARLGIAGLSGQETIDFAGKTWKILAVYQDYSPGLPRLMLDFSQAVKIWPETASQVNSLALYFEDQRVDLELFNLPKNYSVTLSKAIQEQSLAIFDRTFAVTHILQWLALLVAILGMISALAIFVLKQQQEYALLYRLGMPLSQVGILLLGQALVLGISAALLAVPLGAVLAWLLAAVINWRGFGWTITLTWSLWPWLYTSALALLAVLVAVTYPWWRYQQAPALYPRES
jgi:putative ABC transport system permease protein